MSEDNFDPAIYDDPNCLLGGDEADLEITKHKDRWYLDFAGDRYSIHSNYQGCYAPLHITCLESNEGTSNQILSKDPHYWHFEADGNGVTTSPKIQSWGRIDFFRAMRSWPVEGVSDPLKISVIRGHYLGLTLWLFFRELRDSEKKNRLRSLLWNTALIHLKPHVDVSIARREFIYQLFPKSVLAQRAAGEELLWFITEYSTCLQKTYPSHLSKTKWQESTTDVIRTCRHALYKNDFDEICTIGELIQSGEDWRKHILTLLLQDAIKLVHDESVQVDKDLQRQCLTFIGALEHYNSAVSNGMHEIYFHGSDGKLRHSSKGHKKGKVFSPLIVASKLSK